MENKLFTRRNLGILAGMLTAVALTAGALITSTNRPLDNSPQSAPVLEQDQQLSDR